MSSVTGTCYAGCQYGIYVLISQMSLHQDISTGVVVKCQLFSQVRCRTGLPLGGEP